MRYSLRHDWRSSLRWQDPCPALHTSKRRTPPPKRACACWLLAVDIPVPASEDGRSAIPIDHGARGLCGVGEPRPISQRDFPPGTSKWNKIEHRLFSHIAMNWRGIPLVNLTAIVSLIGSTTTASGLRVRSEIDPGTYRQGVHVGDEQMASIALKPHRFHGDWNYTIHPRRTKLNRSLLS